MTLLNAGADINWKSSNKSIVSYAVLGGNPLIIAKCADMRLDFSEAIFEAIRAKHNDLFLWLFQNVLNSKVDAVTSSDRNTYLHVAAEADNDQVIYFCCNQLKMDVNSLNDRKRTPLMLAAMNKSAHAMQALVQHGQLNLNLRDNSGKTALYYAAEFNTPECAKYLLSRPDINPCLIDENNSYGPALYRAAADGNTDVVKALLACPLVDPNQPGSSNVFTPLMNAIRNQKGATSTILAFIENPKVNVCLVDNNGNTALHHAVQSKSTKAVEYIINHPMFSPYWVNWKNGSGETALMVSIKCREKAHFKEMLQFGMNQTKMLDLNADNYKRETPLHIACQSGQKEFVDELLRTQMVDVNRQDYNGKTPLHVACERGQKEMVQALLKVQGINPHIRDYRGKLPRDIKPEFFN